MVHYFTLYRCSLMVGCIDWERAKTERKILVGPRARYFQFKHHRSSETIECLEGLKVIKGVSWLSEIVLNNVKASTMARGNFRSIYDFFCISVLLCFIMFKNMFMTSFNPTCGIKDSVIPLSCWKTHTAIFVCKMTLWTLNSSQIFEFFLAKNDVRIH